MPKKNLKGGRSKKITELVGEMFSQKEIFAQNGKSTSMKMFHENEKSS